MEGGPKSGIGPVCVAVGAPGQSWVRQNSLCSRERVKTEEIGWKTLQHG